jgi:hypothetical protein
MMDGVDFANPSCSIAAVIVSRDRYDGPERTVLVVLKQSTSACGTIFIIDSSVDNDAVQRRFSEFHNTKVIRASVNLGPRWRIWIRNSERSGERCGMDLAQDDDGHPYQNDTLERLLLEAKRRDRCSRTRPPMTSYILSLVAVSMLCILIRCGSAGFSTAIVVITI